ncbi:hypothetical protein GCM10022217_00910 [Chryseobacterium ginsenosidimutans]
MAVFFCLYSCKQELLSTEDSNSVNRTKIEWISKSQIEQNPNLSGKLQSLSKKDPKSDIRKIYTDQENGFTIDTERALLMEDEKRKKTYTFKIDREINGALALENLVLTESGNGYFDAAIIKYAPQLLNSKQNLTNEQVNQYITIDYLGKKSSAEIFSKIQTCYTTVQQQMYVPGSTCASSDHHQYGDSSCQLSGWQAASPGYWTTSYTFIMYSCDDGMPGGGFVTIPTGGGGGDPNSSGLDDLCVQLESTSLGIADKITDLKGKVTLKTETGYIEKTDGSFDYKDIAATNSNSNSLTLGDPTADMTGYLHTHVNDFEDSEGRMRIGFKIFSPADVIYFNQMVGLAQQNGIPLNSIYAVMVSANVNYQIRFTGNVNQIKTMYTNTKEQYNEMYLNYFKANSKASNELNFLKFIDEQMYVKGITLVKMNSNGTFTKKTLNADKTQVIDTDCP